MTSKTQTTEPAPSAPIEQRETKKPLRQFHMYPTARPDVRLDTTTLLIVDPDNADTTRLSQCMFQRGFNVRTVATVKKGLFEIHLEPPAFAIVEMRQEDGHGLELIEELISVRPSASILVLTAYGNLTTAVMAARIGAVGYLSKTSSAQEIYDTLVGEQEIKPAPAEALLSANRIRWEHVQRVYELCNRDTVDAANRMKMNHQTPRRQLSKRAPI